MARRFVMSARKVLNSVLVLVMVLVVVMVLAAMLPLNGGVVAPAQAQGVYERFAGIVIDQQGNPVTGATVKVNGVEAQTASGGSFEIYAARVDRYVINVTKSGYALVSYIENNLYGNAYLRLTVKAVEVIQINPAVKNTVADSRGTQIELPANVLVDSTGSLPTGTVNALMYTYDLANEPMPGDMSAVNSISQSGYLESAGAFWAEFADASGKKYNLAAGQQVTISVSAINTTTTVDLWFYDEANGIWQQEGSARLVNGRFQGQVSHFSAWNFDWEKTTPACVKLEIDKTFYDAYKYSNGDLIIKAKVTAPNGSVHTKVLSLIKPDGPDWPFYAGPHVLYNLPPNATVEFYTPPSFLLPPYATLSTGAPWGWPGGSPPSLIPPYPYSVCNGQKTLAVSKYLTVNIVGNGLVTPTVGTHDYISGTVVPITATANTGSIFAGWSGALSGSVNPTSITMTGNKTVTATFNLIPITYYTLTVTTTGTGSGTVIKLPAQISYTAGTVVTLTATANTGSTFAGWSGAVSGLTSPVTVRMTANKIVTATFQVNSLCDPELPTATKSLGNGQWNTISNWSNGLPNATKDVIVAHEITVPGVGVANFNARNLCISPSGILKGVNSDLTVWVMNVLHSYGQILGADGTAATGGIVVNGSVVGRTPATWGKNINVFAATLLNEKTGQIYAGRGGDDFTYPFTVDISANGTNAGGIDLIVQNKITNHGRIGPRPIVVWYSTGGWNSSPLTPIYMTDLFNDAATGGNGGGSKIYRGNATGGKGGYTILNSPSVLNTGRICSGNGGAANASIKPSTVTGGTSGNITINTSSLVNHGMLCSGLGGNAWIEPNILIAGLDSRIIGDNITLYGGDNFEMQLSDLTEGAITATGSITLAVGQGGVIDLRNNPDNVLVAGEKVKIFADTILLDAGKTLTDMINAPSIVVTSSRILYYGELSGSGQFEARAGTTLPLKFSLLNGAPVSDTYTLSVSDSAGWQLGTLPVTMSLGALTSVELTLEVKIPQTVGASDTITVTATSQTDSTVVAQAAVQVSLLNYQIFLPVVMRNGS
jgi:hypothetical protein